MMWCWASSSFRFQKYFRRWKNRAAVIKAIVEGAARPPLRSHFPHPLHLRCPSENLPQFRLHAASVYCRHVKPPRPYLVSGAKEVASPWLFLWPNVLDCCRRRNPRLSQSRRVPMLRKFHRKYRSLPKQSPTHFSHLCNSKCIFISLYYTNPTLSNRPDSLAFNYLLPQVVPNPQCAYGLSSFSGSFNVVQHYPTPKGQMLFCFVPTGITSSRAPHLSDT